MEINKNHCLLCKFNDNDFLDLHEKCWDDLEFDAYMKAKGVEDINLIFNIRRFYENNRRFNEDISVIFDEYFKAATYYLYKEKFIIIHDFSFKIKRNCEVLRVFLDKFGDKYSFYYQLFVKNYSNKDSIGYFFNNLFDKLDDLELKKKYFREVINGSMFTSFIERDMRKKIKYAEIKNAIDNERWSELNEKYEIDEYTYIMNLVIKSLYNETFDIDKEYKFKSYKGVVHKFGGKIDALKRTDKYMFNPALLHSLNTRKNYSRFPIML